MVRAGQITGIAVVKRCCNRERNKSKAGIFVRKADGQAGRGANRCGALRLPAVIAVRMVGVPEIRVLIISVV